MQGNDLSSETVPRDVVLWEDLLGLTADLRVAAKVDRAIKRGRWHKALGFYETNELLARKIWDLSWRYGLELELLTYHPPEFAKALEWRMDNENMPFRRVWSDSPNLLARRLSVMPDIRTVYHPYPEHQFLYGSRGRVVHAANAHLLVGSM